MSPKTQTRTRAKKASKLISEEKAKRSCLTFLRIHDRRAEKEYNEFSCGHCYTEDCSCEGYSSECECYACEMVANKIEQENTRSQAAASFWMPPWT